MNVDKIPVITVDGPVGSGKGSLSLMLAKHLGYHILDSGALYRVLALAITNKDIDINNQAAIEQEALNLDIKFIEKIENQPAAIILNGRDVSKAIRTEQCGELASKISGYGAVRSALMSRQRDFKQLPGLVADGRDMGTVVFPEAEIKFYLTASQEVRAKRRLMQLQAQGQKPEPEFADLLAEIKIRDDRDMNRPLAPLKPAKDAIIIDSSDMSIQQVIDKMLSVASVMLEN